MPMEQSGAARWIEILRFNKRTGGFTFKLQLLIIGNLRL
jgi:hypothetical protein